MKNQYEETRKRIESLKEKYSTNSYSARQQAQKMLAASEDKYKEEQLKIVENWVETREKIARDLAKRLKDISDGKI
jgi:hypothetical protein